MSLDGGWPCLDFINSAGSRKPTLGMDWIETWEDFLVLLNRIGQLTDNQLAAHLALPPGGMIDIRAFREQLYQLFHHYIETGHLQQDDLDNFNRSLLETYAHTHLVLTPTGGLERQLAPQIHVEKPLWLMTLSAQNLLFSEKLRRVKACDSCGWLFLDTSKNGTRRWCNMAVCGSQVKARNWYQRQKMEGKLASEPKSTKG